MSRASVGSSAQWACLLAGALAAGAWAQGVPPTLHKALELLPHAQRVQVLQRQARLDALPASARARLQQRMAAWEALPARERRERREAWVAWQAMSSLEQALLRNAAATFATLPADEQQALRARFEALDASERLGWQLGPVLGVDYPQLHALLAQVPPAQHDPLLATLRSMSPGERADLAVLAQRTPPQDRDALRRDLLSTAQSQRAQWLRRRVDP
ncbi:DUF3106 domain-containing protein [soil metagenome]